MKTYRRHNCGHRHHTWTGLAHCIWPAASITGDGPYATLTHCGDTTHITLTASLDQARATKRTADTHGCGTTCTRRHHLVALDQARQAGLARRHAARLRHQAQQRAEQVSTDQRENPEETTIHAPAPNICWHDDGHAQRHCRHTDIDNRDLITWGRCRSGQRWFWAAGIFLTDVSAHDWADTEQEAIETARAVVVGLAAQQAAIATQRHGYASNILKDINAEKRKVRPAKKDETTTAPIEYLYAIDGNRFDGNDDWIASYIVTFRITKKTPKRIYYVRSQYDGEDPVIGFVNRQDIEANGEVHNYGVHWCRPDRHLYLNPPDVGSGREPEPDLAELKAAMAAAHPDRGGSDAAFIAARQKYEHAKTRTRKAS